MTKQNVHVQTEKYYFSEDEAEIVEVIVKFQKAGFPLTISKVRKLAWQFADINKIKGFSTKTKKAGYKWAKFFLKHHPKIKVHKSINLSTA